MQRRDAEAELQLQLQQQRDEAEKLREGLGEAARRIAALAPVALAFRAARERAEELESACKELALLVWCKRIDEGAEGGEAPAAASMRANVASATCGSKA